MSRLKSTHRAVFTAAKSVSPVLSCPWLTFFATLKTIPLAKVSRQPLPLILYSQRAGFLFVFCLFFLSLTPLRRDRRSWVSHTTSVFDQHGPCIVVKRPSCCKLKRGIFPHSGGSAWDADGRACGLFPCK